MKLMKRHFPAKFGLMLWVLIGTCMQAPSAGTLDDYVHRPDPAYGWSLYHESSGLFARNYFLKLDSQRWLDESRVDRPLWTHELRAALPRSLFCGSTANTSKVAIIIIGGGRNKPELGREARPEAGFVARTFCRPVFELRQVPNQPLLFAGESKTRKEDGLLAYSADQYLKSDAADWPAHMAMVKSVTQAMTAIQEFSRTREEIPDIDEFILIGTSKRGWTAWLTATTDPRVRGIVPVSIDMPNLREQFRHHLRSYGEYSPALKDYKEFNIACRLNNNSRGQALLGIVDPISYLERLTVPKLILNSAGDEFFVSDSSRFYYDRLQGAKRLRYTLNTEHSQGEPAERAQLFRMARNWVNDILAGREPPGLEWHTYADGTLVVQASQTPREVLLWTADNPSARDFRLDTIGPAWHSTVLSADEDGRYRVRLETPAAGWRAALVEARFGGWFNGSQQVYTTGVHVVPEELPFSGPFCNEAAVNR
ncbi:MAG: PhoPQ-activated protein PqaA family protein [Panacagrimonas sp.]